MIIYDYSTENEGDVHMSIGSTLRIYRKEKNLTQSELAELIGVSTQAVSKWETDAGMPDISQIVPLSRILGVSTDKILGNTNADFETEAREIRNQISDINLITDTCVAKKLYELSNGFYGKYPDVPDIAVVCLETFIELFSKNELQVEKDEFLETCKKYAASIFRYETVTDRILKTNYLMARAYDLCDRPEKAKNYIENLPVVLGFRDYWEAELAYINKNYDVALDRIKKSFAWNARFSSRCIRLAGRIVRASDVENGEKTGLDLDEYMLRIIDAYLSGGDYLPHRQIFQKTSLLVGLISQNINVGNKEKAIKYYEELMQAKNDFFAGLNDIDNKKSLMFIKGDMDGSWNTTEEKMQERITIAENLIKNCK